MGGISSVMKTVVDPDLDRMENEPLTRAVRQEPDDAMAVLKSIFSYIWKVVFFVFVLLPLLGGRLTIMPDFSQWWYILSQINPQAFAGAGIAFSIAISIVGAAWGILLSGSSIAGAAIRTPRMVSRNLISIIFCEAVGIYGLIIALLMNSKMKSPDKFFAVGTASTLGVGTHGICAGFAQSMYTLFAAGLTVGLGNFACGIAVGLVGSACAIADAADKDLFVQILIVEIFASALGIFALIIGILQSNAAEFSCWSGEVAV